MDPPVMDTEVLCRLIYILLWITLSYGLCDFEWLVTSNWRQRAFFGTLDGWHTFTIRRQIVPVGSYVWTDVSRILIWLAMFETYRLMSDMCVLTSESVWWLACVYCRQSVSWLICVYWRQRVFDGWHVSTDVRECLSTVMCVCVY